ncbi:MotA/TolQ/ExbB proton channel family protein [Sulfurovum sp. CS9]|uniref:MotA/TolQ/ExbB proton channel family protein n=1 Tax=Sulfurovum sp. CS9 TaxID=3391146 RepID=UPI0039ED99CA
MKKLILMITALLFATTLNASELSEAYKKEYTFLKAQKSELQSRFIKEETQQKMDISAAGEKLNGLQEKLIKVSDDLKVAQEKLEKLTKKANEVAENGDITSVVTMQATSALKEYGLEMDESNKTSNLEKLSVAFDKSAKLYAELSSIRSEKGKFYLPNGKPVVADIVKVGNIAAFGIAKEATGALAPAGEGKYKLWNSADSSDDAKALFSGEKLTSLDIFVYENLDKEVEFKKEKTVEDTVRAGGVIGYIILALGLLGLLLIALRVVLLSKSGSNVEKLTKTVVEKLNTTGIADAQEAIKGYKGSTARVLKATLRNITRDREHIEDIVMENILNESSAIDKFGSFVLVIAAVAPLLGLLGTVTGMISTFDIITEHGTGDPKLLSGGISEALVTTMLGLIVAIPLLLLGNLLSGWAQNIKDSMEQSALHIINVFEKNNVER